VDTFTTIPDGKWGDHDWCRTEKQSGTAKVRRVTQFTLIGGNCGYGVHNANLLNGERAVKERVFFVKGEEPGTFARPPRPETGAFKRLLGKFRTKLIRRVPRTAKMSADEFLSHYSGRRLTSYSEARDSLYVREIRRVDAFISAFVKAEKIDFTSKANPAPRLIQPRSPRYGLSLGLYIKPIEHAIYRAIDHVFGAPTVAKGLNAVQTGAVMRSHWDEFTHPVAITLDASRFDQHISTDALKWEHSIYLQIFAGDPELHKLLSWQLVNRGYLRTLDGVVKYSAEGGRASGDMNTGLGNVLLMCAMMHAFLSEMTSKFRLLNNGDDCVVMVEKEEAERVMSRAVTWFKKLGFTMKVEGYTDLFEHIDFCQARPVFDGVSYIMVRDPRATLDKDMLSVKPILGETHWKRQITAIAECGLSLAGNMPVLCAFYDMMDLKQEVTRVYECGMENLSRGMKGGRRAPTAACRDSFYAAFGVTPDEQRALEEFYDSITPTWQPLGGAPRILQHELHNNLYRKRA